MKSAVKPFVIIAGICTLIYFPALTGSFLTWDDTQHILLNPWLREGRAGYFWTHSYYGMFIPVTYIVWSWLYGLSASPALFHVFNLLLHILNSWMIYNLVCRYSPKLDRNAVLVAALIFACHPLQVEPVAWISGGRDLLAAFFALLALTLAVGTRSIGFALAASLMFGFSLLAKPSLLLLPAAVWWLQSFHPGPAKVRRPVLVSWAILSALAGAVAVSLQSGWAGQKLGLSVWEKGLIALDTLGFYAGKIILPVPLMADYGRDPHSVIEAFLYVPSLFLFGALIGFFIWLKSRIGRLATGIAGFFLLILAPVLGAMPFAAQTVSTVFDRYMYFAMFAVVLAAAVLLTSKRALQAGMVALVALSALSFQNTWKWRSNRTLAGDMIEKNPRSYDGYNNLALAEIEARNWSSAKHLLREAASLKPDSAVAWSNLGYVYWEQKDLVAIFADLDPRLQSARFVEQNRVEPQALGLMFRMGARAYSSVRKMDVAKDYYCHALQYDPSDPDLQREVKSFLKDDKGC